MYTNEKKKFILRHTHRHGTDVYLFKTSEKILKWPYPENSEDGPLDEKWEKLLDFLMIDYEYHRDDEFLEIYEIPKKIKTFKYGDD